jgi:acetyltransferase-like isoleucine patch superfamily enzyme
MRHQLRRAKFGAIKLRQIALAYLSDFEALYDYPPSSRSNRRLLRAYLRAKGVVFEGPVWAGTQFRVFGAGRISLGPRCSIGNFSTITSHGSIQIGSDFLCSSHLVVNSGTHEILTGKPKGTTIRIGANVWAGVRVSIIEDTVVGDNCVIAAGSVLRGEYPPNSLVAGVPAKAIRPIDRRSGKIWSAFGPR